MSGPQSCRPAPIGFDEVVDYWAGDLTQAEVDRIEEHVFACADCARELAAAEALAAGVAAVVREGRVNTVVTDGMLNRLAADGVRIRMYTLDGSGVVRFLQQRGRRRPLDRRAQQGSGDFPWMSFRSCIGK